MKKNTISLAFLISVSLVLTGCDEKKWKNIDDNSPLPAQPTRYESKIYVDSVPSGADIYLLPSDEKDKTAKDVLLGKTPLIVESSQCPSKKFWVDMNMEYYISKVSGIPEMEEWIKSFKSDGYFGTPMMSQEYFKFDTSDSRNTSKMGGGLVSVGPVYTLEWPVENRICAVFIPKGKKKSLFYSLMPPVGTYQMFLNNGWRTSLQKNRLSESQIQEALECLTRCGKYMAQVKDPFKDGSARLYVYTAQGGKNDRVVISQYGIRIIPGFNDEE